MQDVYDQWGENIRLQREARRWSQEDLAQKLDVTRAAVSFWESGQRVPKDSHKLAIASVFQIPVRTLFPLLDTERVA